MTGKELDGLEWIAKHHPIEVFDHMDAQIVLSLIAAARERDALLNLIRAVVDSAETHYPDSPLEPLKHLVDGALVHDMEAALAQHRESGVSDDT
jgi:hypothetical protein